MSMENKKTPKGGRRKKNKFSKAFRQFFGCISKNIERRNSSLTSVSCQCQIEKDLETEIYLLENKSTENVTVSSTVSEDFRSSLKKLDSLINTLHNIHDVYKASNSLQCYCDIQDGDLGKENALNSAAFEEDVLKFNINFNKNTVIECQTSKGKHSLKIVHNTGQQNFSPFILHRCESEFLMSRRSLESISTKASSEIFTERTDQLQRSYHTLSGRFGGTVNLSLCKTNFLNYMRSSKNDIKTLKSILFYVECVTNREKNVVPFYFGEITRWFLGPGNNLKKGLEDETKLKLQDYKYLEAKTRATNFCRFYVLEKKSKENKSKEKRKKKYINKGKY